MTESEQAEQEEQRNRRRHTRVFGVNFEVPLTWLVTMLVLGIAQFGIFWQRFNDFGDRLAEVQSEVRVIAAAVSVTSQQNAVQDIRLQEYSRRLERLEERLK